MTVSTVVDHNDYTGNGVTTSFPYKFRIFKKTDLAVSVIDLSENITVLVLDTDYTVTNAGGYNGGNVVLTAPLATGWQISIARELEPTQETDLRNQGKFFAEVHEDAFDKLTMLIQQAYSAFRLALRKPSSIANWYDALNNYIRNLRDPRDPQDAATKNYVDTLASSNLSRTLRVPEPINQLPAAADRANKIPAFDSAGNAIVIAPPSGSASDVMVILAGKDGYSYIGEVQSIAGFNGMTGATGKKVRLKGWYAGSAIGGGEFYFDTTVAKSKHDGGKYISPTVPYTTATAFVSGTGETDPSGFGVWVRSGITDALRGEWYGMINGIDVTTMSQKMANTAGVEGYGLIWPVGKLLLSGPVNVLCDNSASGQVKFLRGAGKRGTSLIIDVLTNPSTVGLVVIGSIGKATQTYDMLTIEGFTIIGNGTGPALNDKTGTGMYLQDISGPRLIGIDFKNLYRGCLIQNCLYIYGEASGFESCQTGLLCRRSGLVTGANAVELVRCNFADNIFYGLQAIESHAFKLSNCAFEGNGRPSFHGETVTPVAAAQFSDGGTAGGNIAVFDTCYFEANIMPDIKYISSTNRVQMVTIKNTVFSNTRDNVTSPHVLFQTTANGLGAGKYILEMQGNTFYNGKPLEATPRPNVVINGFASLGYGKADFLNYNNYFYGEVTIDAIVAHKKSSDDGFICRGLSAGGFTAASSRNVISCTRQSTGTYRVVTNQLTNALTFQVQLDNLGFANISTAENNEALTITTYNQSGALADVNFRVIGKMV